jgi:3-hydroxyisobutyryl-CoA hydrolase
VIRECAQLHCRFAEHTDAIHACFTGASVDDIIANLEKRAAAGGVGEAWASKQLATIGRMSPSSLKITHKQLTLGATMDLAECFKMEYRMTQGCLRADDFYEGIRALLIDRDNSPVWSPGTLAGVTQAMVDDHFAPLSAEQELEL